MRKVISVAGIVMIGFAGNVSAQTATSTATFEVQAINEVSFSGNPAALVISNSAQMAGVADTVTWGVVTNDSLMKVTGKIDAAMPTGVTLELSLEAPTAGAAGALSAGSQALGTTAVDLVTKITETDEDLLDAIFTLKALPTAGAVAQDTRTVTLTITQGV